jgi:L-threonylcarbamoyladenylate synthase
MRIIEKATTLLLEGKLVAIPTETVYGLGADAKNPDAIQKIYTVKGRPSTNPLIIHIPNQDAMAAWAIDIPKEAYQLAKAFWPGPLTLVLKRHPSVPKIVTGGQETVALRVPNHPLTLELLHAFQGGIAAPSANRYGKISPTTAEHVREDLGMDVSYILDGGPCKIGIESTIVYCLDPTPFILRQGNIAASAIAKVLNQTVTSVTELPLTHKANSVSIPSVEVPGQSASHYAPSQPLYLLSKENLFNLANQYREKGQRFSVLSFSVKPENFKTSSTSALVQWISLPLDPEKTAQQLYHLLRILDKEPNSCILVEKPPLEEEWLAIIDRLQRAARPIE